MTRKTGIAALMLLGALPLAAFAASDWQQQQAKPGAAASTPADPVARNQTEPSMFQQLDTNHDGFISKAEARRSASVTAKFDKLDANHDGRISVDEYEKGMTS